MPFLQLGWQSLTTSNSVKKNVLEFQLWLTDPWAHDSTGVEHLLLLMLVMITAEAW